MMLPLPLELFVVVMITVFVFWHDSQVMPKKSRKRDEKCLENVME